MQSTCFELVIFITNHKRPHCQCVLVDRYRLFFLHLPFQSSTLRYNLFYILYLRIIYFFNFTAANAHTLPVFLSYLYGIRCQLCCQSRSIIRCIIVFFGWTRKLNGWQRKLIAHPLNLLLNKKRHNSYSLSLSIRHPPTINWLEWSEKWLFLFSWRKKQRKEEKCASDCWKWLFLLLCLFFFAWSIGAQSLLSRKINQPQEKSPKKQRPFLKEVSFLLIRFKIPFTVRFERN